MAEEMNATNIDGSIVFFPGQLNHIANFNETALSLDGTSNNTGG